MWHWLSSHAGWITAGGIALCITVCAMLRGAVYRYVLRKLDEAERLISAEHFIETGHFPVYVPTEDIVKKSGVWPRLARLALQWKSNKKNGLI